MTELDIERPDELLTFLRSGYIQPDERPTIIVLAGGVSNRTVLVERPSGEAWVLKQALGKLRVDVDWFSDPARIEREAMGIRHLADLAPKGAITPLVFENAEHHLLAMQAVPRPHENWKERLLAGQIEQGEVEQFGRLLGTIHRNAWQQREKLRPLFQDAQFFESLRLEPYYAYSADQAPEVGDVMRDLIATTRRRRLTLVHGDYSPKNILVRNGRLVLLDHEVIHWGDPAFDLGFSLTHLLSKTHHCVEHRKTFMRMCEIYWNAYSDEVKTVPWAAEVEPYAVWHTLGCLLARAVGRSKLEYLSEQERSRQRQAACVLLQHRPSRVVDLIQEFIAKV